MDKMVCSHRGSTRPLFLVIFRPPSSAFYFLSANEINLRPCSTSHSRRAPGCPPVCYQPNDIGTAGQAIGARPRHYYHHKQRRSCDGATYIQHISIGAVTNVLIDRLLPETVYYPGTLTRFDQICGSYVSNIRQINESTYDRPTQQTQGTNHLLMQARISCSGDLDCKKSGSDLS